MKPKLVVFEMHHLGDALIALPFLRGATRIFETTVFCRPGTARMLQEALPDAHVEASETRTFFRLPKLGRTDAAVSVWPDSRIHLAMARTGAGRRIGFQVNARNFYGAARPWRARRLLAGRLAETVFSLIAPILTHPLDRAEAGQAQGASWAQMATVLGFEPDYSFPWIPLPTPPRDFDDFLANARKAGKKILVLHPGGRLPGKRWPTSRFQELLSGYLSSNDIAVAIIQPPGELCPVACHPEQKVFEVSSIASLGSIFAKADGVLCNDSLASHLAAAVGVRVTTIFGSGDPQWFAPFANQHLVVATNACRFRPCVDRCVMKSVVCLESVSIPLVEQKLSAMFHNPLNPAL
jgi:heptosyltransferase-2